MAEKFRSIETILTELFEGSDSALAKYAKVRHTQYEIKLWRERGLPLQDVGRDAKVCFSGFLSGETLAGAREGTIKKALERLDHAVKDGCHGRCTKLVKELNEALVDLGLKPVKEVEKFLDWLTYAGMPRMNFDGTPVTEKPYGFVVVAFCDKQNREEFWKELKSLLQMGRIVSMQDIERIVLLKRRAVKIK